MNGYRAELKAAQTAFIEATMQGKRADKLRKRMTDAASMIKGYTEDYEAIEADYKKNRRAAVAVIASMADLRATAENA